MNSEPEITQSKLVEVNVPDLDSLTILEGRLGVTGNVKLLLPKGIFLSGELSSNNSDQVVIDGKITAYSSTPRGGIAYYIKRTSDGIFVCLRQAGIAPSL